MKLALIGAGKWGKNYLRAIKNIPDTEIKYVCSGSNSLENMQDDYVKLSDYKLLLEKQDLDGVIIAVPTIKHFEIIKFFLLRDIPILVEKPLVSSLKEALVLKSVIEKKKKLLMVGNIFLYNSAFQAFEKHFKKIKKIYYLNFEACDNGPIRKDVSALWDWASHDLSMCLSLLGKPEAVSGWGICATSDRKDFYDMIYAKLFFKNNLSAFFRMGWLSPFKKKELMAVGEGEALVFNDIVEQKLVRINKDGKEEIPHVQSEPLGNEIRAFIRMIKTGENPKSDFEMNFSIIEIIDAIERSIKEEGKVIKI